MDGIVFPHIYMLEVLAPNVFKNRAFEKIIKFKQMYKSAALLLIGSDKTDALIRRGTGGRELSHPLQRHAHAHREERTERAIR